MQKDTGTLSLCLTSTLSKCSNNATAMQFSPQQKSGDANGNCVLLLGGGIFLKFLLTLSTIMVPAVHSMCNTIGKPDTFLSAKMPAWSGFD